MSSKRNFKADRWAITAGSIITLCLIFTPFASIYADQNDDGDEKNRSTKLEQAAPREQKTIEEIVVVGTQIKGAAISDALAVSVVDAGEIEAMGVSSGDELFDAMPEMGQNFFTEGEAHAGGVNSVRGDVGAFNLRNMGTGNTLVLLNGRRMVNMAGYQTEEVGGAFVPVNSSNSNAIPVYGTQRVEVLRDGASAIYGADAVAGVINTVLKTDFEGFSVRVRYDDYDNIPRDDQRANLEWGKFFNEGRTNVGVFVDYYHRDRVNAGDDPKWADENYSRYLSGDWADEFGTNYSSNSAFPQIDFRSSAEGRLARDAGMADGSGEIQTFPAGDSRCTFQINAQVCGAPDSSSNVYPYNKNTFRDVLSDLDRYNVFLYINHEMDNGVESFTEISWYEADSNFNVDASYLSIGESDLQIGPEYYYNPFGPCGSPNRIPEADTAGIDCNGERLEVDLFRALEAPRVSETNNRIYRFLQGFRGTAGDWDWEAVLVWSEAERNNVTHNRISNTIMQELLNSPSPDTYNIFSGAGGDLAGLQPALVDVYRKDKSDLKMIDFKFSHPELFNMPAGPVGFLAGMEYREESFLDDRDPRLDGTIAYTAYEGATFPIVSDVANSSPTADNGGDRDVTSLFTEFAIPLHETLDVQLAVRYEDFSDVGSTTVGKFAFGWQPIEQLMFRGSWSEAFRAPNLITINEALVVRQNGRIDAACDYVEDVTGANLVMDCTPSVQRRASGSKDLVPEESTNTSIGLVWDPMDDLTVTVDFWTIEKEQSIGLFGENNHAIYDLLLRLRAGTANCDMTFNPAVGRDDPDEDDIPFFYEAGICPLGDIDYVDDTYTNLDTRTIEGHDIGIYYDLATDAGEFNFKVVGTFYDKYEQKGSSGIALEVQNAIDSGELPAGTALRGYGDLLQRDGNYDEKYNASVRWSKGDWGAFVQMLKVGTFYDADSFLTDDAGTVTNWWLPSMTTYNASVDYDFDAFGADNRIRLGVNNLTDERAPLCDCRFGYWGDAHRDFGRYWYLDWQMRFE